MARRRTDLLALEKYVHGRPTSQAKRPATRGLAPDPAVSSAAGVDGARTDARGQRGHFDPGASIELRVHGLLRTDVWQHSAAQSIPFAQGLHEESLPYTFESFDDAPGAESFSWSPDVSTAASTEPSASARSADNSVTAAKSQPARPAADPDRADDADQFEADLREIMSGRKRYEQAQSLTSDDDEFPPRAGGPAASGAPTTTGPATGAETPAPAPAADRHAIFDSMAQSMAYANAFDLGSISLEQRLDEFDRELEQKSAEPPKSAARPGRDSTDAAPGYPEPRSSPGVADSSTPSAAMAFSAIDLVEDLESIMAAAQSGFSPVQWEVPLVPQQTGFSCWAAGAAMIVGWRDRVSIDPSEIAAAVGYWAQYKTGLHAEDTTVLTTWGLVPEAAQTHTVQGFRDLLAERGPLWVAAAVPGPHIRVVTGISGDGTPDGTLVHLNDPWEPGMQQFRMPNNGGAYTETYSQFVARQERLARSESNLQGIYVAHLPALPEWARR